jgi:hypothetical protein
MTETPGDDRLPPPLPGDEAAARRVESPISPPDGSEPSQLRQVGKPVLIGLVGFLVAAAIPIVMVIILGIVAQMIITSH